MVLQTQRKKLAAEQKALGTTKEDGLAGTKPSGAASAAVRPAPKRRGGRRSLGGLLFRSLTCRRMNAALSDANSLVKEMDTEVELQAAKERTWGEVCRAEVMEYERAKAASDDATAEEAAAVARYMKLSEQLRAHHERMEEQRRRQAYTEALQDTMGGDVQSLQYGPPPRILH